MTKAPGRHPAPWPIVRLMHRQKRCNWRLQGPPHQEVATGFGGETGVIWGGIFGDFFWGGSFFRRMVLASLVWILVWAAWAGDLDLQKLVQMLEYPKKQ